MRDYVHPHGGVSSTPVQQYNNITVTWQDAENAVRERSIKFAKDQKDALTALASMPGLFTCLQGPPGTSMSLIMTARFICLIEALQSNERLLWLTRTRKQRSKALRDVRHILSDPRLALSLGRRDDTSACVSR